MCCISVVTLLYKANVECKSVGANKPLAIYRMADIDG